MSNIIEIIRKQAISDVFTRGTMLNAWDVWHEGIEQIISYPLTPSQILNIGDHLSEIFRSTGSAGRGQAELSGGGSAWESLVLWYINLCCVGSRVVAIKKKTQVPTPFRDAMTVSYGNFACNTESDITVLVFPDNELFTSPNANLLKPRGSINYETLDADVSTHFNDFEIGIIQCKTNWNDNAQIPMLWDMVYQAGGFRDRQIRVGKNGFRFRDLTHFTYSFVTVPTSNMDGVNPNSTCVRRVKNISGGNYWGKESENGIADSIKEIFNNYASGFGHGGIRTSINNSIAEFQAGRLYDYFRL